MAVTETATETPRFDLCQPALALRLVLSLQAATLALVLMVAAPGQWLALQAAVSLAVLAASLAWLGLLCLLQPVLLDWRPRHGTALALAWAGCCAMLAQRALDSAGLIQPLGALSLRDLGAALCGMLAAALAWGWLHQRARLAQPAHTQARLAELQARIRPHFLFNALNAALALVRIDPDRAERVLEDLSALFRQAMAQTGSDVALAAEIELAQRYLAIEQVRFGERLRVTWDIEAAVGAARVPPLVLQPLVENAVKHGVEPSRNGARVHISARARQGLVRVVVSNTMAEVPTQPGSGMALKNVAERLKLLHDLAAHVEGVIETDPSTGTRRFVARLTLPL